MVVIDINEENVHGTFRGMSYTPVRHLATLGCDTKGRAMQVTLGYWGKRQPLTMDIMIWDGDEYLGGISMMENEVRRLRHTLKVVKDFGQSEKEITRYYDAEE